MSKDKFDRYNIIRHAPCPLYIYGIIFLAWLPICSQSKELVVYNRGQINPKNMRKLMQFIHCALERGGPTGLIGVQSCSRIRIIPDYVDEIDHAGNNQ